MKVKDLISELQNVDPEIEVIMQKDSEGNGFSPLSGIDPEAIYMPDSTWSGTVYDSKWSASDACFDDDEWEDFKSREPRCLVLFPVN